MAQASAWIEEHRQAWEHRMDRFQRYAEHES
jgi:hypothetical protein